MWPLQREQQASLSHGGFRWVVRIYSRHGGSLCPCVYLFLDHYCRSCLGLEQSEKEVTENADVTNASNSFFSNRMIWLSYTTSKKWPLGTKMCGCLSS